MSSREDVIEVPIEIQTSDLEELQRLIQQLQEAKTTVDQTKSARRKIPSGGIGAPFQRTEEEPMGIFRPSETSEALPTKSRDTKSRQAFQRMDSFHEMRNKINDLEESNMNMVNSMINVATTLGFNTQLLSGGLKGLKTIKGISKLPPTSGAPIKIPAGAGAGIIGRLGSLAAMAGPVGAAVAGGLVIFELISNYIDTLFRAGGVWDRRFKRIIKDEIAGEAERAEKSSINQGFRTIITTAYPAIRGSAGVSSTLESVRSGKNIYDTDMNFKVRGG